MNITDDLERLGKLHKDGTLNDGEFARAKAKLLSQETEGRSDDAGPEIDGGKGIIEDNSLGTAANRYVTFRIVMGILGFIIFLIFLFGVFLPHLPSNNSPFGR